MPQWRNVSADPQRDRADLRLLERVHGGQVPVRRERVRGRQRGLCSRLRQYHWHFLLQMLDGVRPIRGRQKLQW